MNNPKYTGRQILLTRDNFGSGSSREHAVWAIQDYGFKQLLHHHLLTFSTIIASKMEFCQFSLSREEVDYLFRNADNVDIEIDLSNQQVIVGSKIIHFEIDEYRKKTLLEGLDEIGITLQLESEIAEYEKKNNKVILPQH